MNIATLLRSVSDSDDTAYVLSPERRLLRTNSAWTRFASDNDGLSVLERWTRGSLIDDAIPEVLRAFYITAFERALASGTRWGHEYECSSPTAYRRFRMELYPVDELLLLTVHARVIERPHDHVVSQHDDLLYADAGVITMCAHCRRVRNPLGTQRWDWVPAYLKAPPENLSHGLCGVCAEYYFG